MVAILELLNGICTVLAECDPAMFFGASYYHAYALESGQPPINLKLTTLRKKQPLRTSRHCPAATR